VPLDANEVAPPLEKVAVLQGLRCNLMDVSNTACYTDSRGYKSPYNLDKYPIRGMLLPEYFRAVFQKGFTQAGMLVLPYTKPDTGAPYVKITLLAVSPAEFRFTLNVQKGRNVLLNKTYSVVEPPLPDRARNKSNLKERAYRMTRGMVEAVLKDQDFQVAMKAGQIG
jgi:hypothetical protein